MDSERDEVIPENKWEFDEEVSGCFEDMLRRSIPQYDVMRKTVTDLAEIYIRPNSDVLDLGCSRGDAIAPLLARSLPSNRFFGLEISEPMRKIAQTRFKILDDRVRILDFDLRKPMGELNVVPSVVLSVLTLQFVPMEHRQRCVLDAYKKLTKGGAFILVEKVLGSSAEIDQNLVELYYAGKKANGYSQEAIERKRMSLEGVLVPLTASGNEALLKQAGFRQIDCFWRFLNFCGWIAIKE